MLLPGFADGFRAPARFMMIAALAIAVAAGLAFVRLTASRPGFVRLAAAAAAIALLAVDSWPAALPAAAVPAPMMTLPGIRAVVLELPLGGVFDDIAAVYRSVFHGRPVVNGYSGYDPPAYQILKLALERQDETVVPVLASVRASPHPAGHDFEQERELGRLCPAGRRRRRRLRSTRTRVSAPATAAQSA